MRKPFNKYLFFIIALLLSGFANLPANQDYNTIGNPFFNNHKEIADVKSDSLYQHLNFVSFNPSQQENENKIITEVIDLENLEEVNENLSFNHKSTLFGNSQILGWFSSKLQNKIQYFKPYFGKVSLRLYVKFQVFRI
ncbi:hypothetical protein C7447_103255 [Tenacibaculum adriaticum]|uniref:Uncharacterized protein n=2 Tax=Tenacibaculum adriaticum TaxID=413713 RepID=A0A5S5DQT2_9FLAO|nr:hypothetical protein C7447_103255 [Tenacibaculum adriaticum]